MNKISVQQLNLGLERIDTAYQIYKPVAMFGMFSGGHDSLTATFIASRHPKFTAALHINTGIGVPQTREFVRQICSEQGWELRQYNAVENCFADGRPDPMIYADLVKRYGFPGPPGHGMMYNKLKQRQLRRAIRDAKKGHSRRACVMLVSGCRSQESERRMGNVEEVQKQGAELWVAPIHDMVKIDTGRFIEFMGLRRNPVVDLIHKSGECLCGAFAKPGELEELGMWFPDTANEIKALEVEVKAKFGWGWEGRPPKKVRPPKACKLKNQNMCHNCNVQNPEECHDQSHS